MALIVFVTDAREYHRIDEAGYTLKDFLRLVKGKASGCTVRRLIIEPGWDFYDAFEHLYGEKVTTMDVCLHGLTAPPGELDSEYSNSFKVNAAGRGGQEFIEALIENRVQVEELILRSCNQYPDQWRVAFRSYGLDVEVWAPGLAAVGGASTFYIWDPYVPLCQGELLYRLYESRGYLPELR
ncbi:MAG: hypothetical protein V3T41_05340 [bacterium]